NACLQSPAMQSSQSLWGLDALDGKLDDKYGFDLTGEGVNVYVVDSGINVRHPEYEGRATNIFTADTVKNQEQDDCTGHGSHVAGLIGGKTVGVAKRVNLFGLRIIDCGKTGSVSDAVEALNFLSTNMKMPAVINLSLGSTESLRGDTLPRALNALARRGASVVIAAGNSEREVCDTSAPSMTTVPNTFVVGALDRPSAQELARDNYNPRRAKFSNFGNCVRWWAPGVDMWSTANTTIDVQGNRMAFESRQGTSQAAPLVAGVLAHHLQANPNLTPSELQARLA
ncbi:peptidase S8/S53 domain-containing protein, partial [Catenaria anguillulae PL171]